MTHWTIHAARHGDGNHPGPEPRTGDVARLRATARRPGRLDESTTWIRIRVEDRDEHGYYRGEVLDAQPEIPGIAPGMWIAFGREHITTLESEREVPAQPARTAQGRPAHPTARPAERLQPRPTSLLALCSRRVATSPRLATTIVRVKPRNAQDSGLRLLADGEDPAVLHQADTAAVCRLPWLLQQDPSLTFLRDVGVGARFERAHPGEPWARVDVGTRRRVPVV